MNIVLVTTKHTILQKVYGNEFDEKIIKNTVYVTVSLLEVSNRMVTITILLEKLTTDVVMVLTGYIDRFSKTLKIHYPERDMKVNKLDNVFDSILADIKTYLEESLKLQLNHEFEYV